MGIDMRTLFFICMLLTDGLLLLAADRDLRSGADSQKRFEALILTTPAYEQECLNLLIKEANQVAEALQLGEPLPIISSNLTACYISPPRIAQHIGIVGNISTSNYTYYIAIGSRFSFLERSHLQNERIELEKKFLWHKQQFDTNAAYQLASQFLAAVSIDVKALNAQCNVRVEAFTPAGNQSYFVPLYSVRWEKPGQNGSAAFVELFPPTKTILQLRVTKPEFILRPPLVFTNLAELLLQTNEPAMTDAPRQSK